MMFATLPAASQEVTIDAKDRPLNEVLIDLAAGGRCEISFDDRALAQYRVTLSETFPSPEAAIRKLIAGLPLGMEKNGPVLVILPMRDQAKTYTKVISGRVLDRNTREPLPYAHIVTNGRGFVADITGGFSVKDQPDSLAELRISYLGYYILDTALVPATGLTFFLTPAMIGLSEVVIVNAPVSMTGSIGEKAGQVKLNQQIAGFLPGFGDNSVFNLLRLQPGILAAGEQTNDLVIWGSYPGLSKVMFDGFTVYSLKNFNDNISAFNPLMAKDIEVYKGGYDARFGDRAGGIVNITGKNGNMSRPSFTLNVNNMTLNSMAEVPLSKNSSLVAAFRTTYYELYNPSEINSRFRRNNDRDTANDVDLDVIPDYRFRDLNLKYSAFFRGRDLFYISLYAGSDRFYYAIDEPVKQGRMDKETREQNMQAGGAAFYGVKWGNGSATDFNINFTRLTTEYNDRVNIIRNHNQTQGTIRDLESVNTIREFTAQADHRFTPGRIHRMEAGWMFKRNVVELREDTFAVSQVNLQDTGSRLVAYFQDEIALRKNLALKAGLRLNHSLNLKKLYWEPRVSLSYTPATAWKLNAAWGIYDQFIALSSVVDDLGNYRYLWAFCDNEDIPVLRANHYVAGVSYLDHGWTVSFEGYFKNTIGLTRYVRNTQYHSEGVYEGVGRGYGLDVMVKKEYRGHTAWVAYSLSRTEEVFEYFLDNSYRRAPQDQRHEVKAALLLNFDPLYFSVDYVYGSGFPPLAYLQSLPEEELDYSRLDAALIYKFLDRKIKGEVGLSVLNVLNTKNIKYANFERVPGSQSNSINLYAEAIPITPALYLKLSY